MQKLVAALGRLFAQLLCHLFHHAARQTAHHVTRQIVHHAARQTAHHVVRQTTQQVANTLPIPSPQQVAQNAQKAAYNQSTQTFLRNWKGPLQAPQGPWDNPVEVTDPANLY